MNKEITIYELLGLINDGKAPRKIKYENDVFYLHEYDYICENNDFINSHETNYLLCFIFSLPENVLNIKVEILEEDKSTIEKIKIEEDIVCNKFIRNEYGSSCYIKTHDRIIIEKLNEVIDYINKIIELDGKND